MREIVFPRKVKSDFYGYQFLSGIASETLVAQGNHFIFDFKDVTWFEANLAAILGGVIILSAPNQNKFSITNIDPTIRNILERNAFLKLFQIEKLNDPNNTVIEFRRFNSNDEMGFKRYLAEDLLSMPDLPSMSDAAKKKILESIWEIFNNASLHSGCNQVFSCGQYFPNLHELKFTIVDVGISIKKNVCGYLKRDLSGADSIEWAVEHGNTTRKGSIPGGLGLAIIRRFLEMNEGDIQIVSSDGYWKEKHQSIERQTMNVEFPGTIVNLEFNMKDLNNYVLKEEIKDDSIF